MGDCGCVLPLFFFQTKYVLCGVKKKYPTGNIPGGVFVLRRLGTVRKVLRRY